MSETRTEPPLKLTKDEAEFLMRMAAHLDKAGAMGMAYDHSKPAIEQSTELDKLIAAVALAGLTRGKPYMAVGNVLRYLAKKGME